LCKAPEMIAGRSMGSAADAAACLMDEYDLAVVPWDVGPDRYLRFTASYRPEDLEQLEGLAGRLDLNQS
jgi:hypothetical protein